jgi:hypothetical protein
MRRSYCPALAFVVALLPLAAGLGGCIHNKASSGDKSAAEDELLPEVSVEDPDPEKDGAGPAFCNPTGKQGEDLRRCNEANAALDKSFDDEAKKREPWFNFTPDSWEGSKELDQKFVASVVKEDEAVKRLEAAPLVELSGTEAQYFTGKAALPGVKPYLVRALMYFKETGNFAVFEKDQAIYVRHDSLGNATPSERRSAVVVYLAYKPKQVYVDCQVAE